ncbi:MAG: rhomboid family intramembrane serine protease [Bacteroidetes bacterium]|nr:rhomboid family intramembrane serine protease [Bacteroidota bacterium]
MYNQRSLIPPGIVGHLMIINIILFVGFNLIFRMKGVDLSENLMLYNPLRPEFKFWQPLTSMFLHGDLGHLAMNMIGLYFTGIILEREFGSSRFLVFYLSCGLGSAFIYMGWTALGLQQAVNAGDLDKFIQFVTPSLGASGAIYGLLVAVAILYPKLQVQPWGLFSMPLGMLVIIYGAIDVLMVILNTPNDRIARMAHIGGLIIGAILTEIYRRKSRFSK